MTYVYKYYDMVNTASISHKFLSRFVIEENLTMLFWTKKKNIQSINVKVRGQIRSCCASEARTWGPYLRESGLFTRARLTSGKNTK